MKFDDIHLGMLVEDRWFGHWGIGRVVKKMKTVIKVVFPGQTHTYDKSHVQFLEEAT